MPAKTIANAPKTPLAVSVQPHQPTPALPELSEMRGNEREIDLSALSPRQQAALPIVACIPTIAHAARAANYTISFNLRATELDNLETVVNLLQQH